MNRDYHVTINGRPVDTESFRSPRDARRAAHAVERMLGNVRAAVDTITCYGTCTGR